MIAPSYMVYTADYSELLQTHIDSGADITLMYHSVDTAKDEFLSCYTLDINKQKGVDAIQPNRGNAKNKNIFMDTYVMKKDLFLDLVTKAHKMSAMYSLVDIIDEECHDLDVRAVPHRGFFASITDFKSYYDANMSLIDLKNAMNLFVNDWPIYTRTNDSCPTQYFDSSSVKSSVVSNGCLIEGNDRELCHRKRLHHQRRRCRQELRHLFRRCDRQGRSRGERNRRQARETDPRQESHRISGEARIHQERRHIINLSLPLWTSAPYHIRNQRAGVYRRHILR